MWIRQLVQDTDRYSVEFPLPDYRSVSVSQVGGELLCVGAGGKLSYRRVNFCLQTESLIFV